MITSGDPHNHRELYEDEGEAYPAEAACKGCNEQAPTLDADGFCRRCSEEGKRIDDAYERVMSQGFEQAKALAEFTRLLRVLP